MLQPVVSDSVGLDGAKGAKGNSSVEAFWIKHDDHHHVIYLKTPPP